MAVDDGDYGDNDEDDGDDDDNWGGMILQMVKVTALVATKTV